MTRPSSPPVTRQSVEQSVGVPALLELAERCEQATGPDEVLDEAIRVALSLDKTLLGFGIGMAPTDEDYGAAPFTASLDAAMTLVPEGCREWHCGRNIKTGKGQAYLLDPATMRGPVYVHAETPALALCAAALRASAQGGPHD